MEDMDPGWRDRAKNGTLYPPTRPSFNREQHRYLDDRTASHNCKTCGLRKGSPAHVAYERAAQPFRQAAQAGNAFNEALRAAAGIPPRMSKPALPPSTGNMGKDHRFAKWKRNLADSKPGSDRESVSLAMLETFAKGYPDLENWVKAEKLKRQTTEEPTSVAEDLMPISYHAPSRAIDYPHTTHIHFALDEVSKKSLIKAFGGGSIVTTNTIDKSAEISNAIQEANDMSNIHQDPSDMERAALRLATLAEEIRKHDEREPQGEEPVITWKHTFGADFARDLPGQTYTYVAVKLGDRWYVTGNKQAGQSFEWRDFLDKDWAKEVADGEFLICTEWTPAS